MDRYDEGYNSYSWHQSHDQATVLVIVPHDTVEEDVVVVLEGNHLVAGVVGQTPTIKGKLYGAVDTTSTTWQLEHRGSRGTGPRQRTTSSTSTISSQSSFAIVSDVEFTSSFADSTQTSDAEDFNSASNTSASSPVIPAMSPWLSPAWENNSLPTSSATRPHPLSASSSAGPGAVLGRLPFNTNPSLSSSYSSVDSLNPKSGRLLTLYLDKAEPGIWPSLIVGPVPETMSPSQAYPYGGDAEVEKKYNIDPSSLALLGLEFLDIRKDQEEAFEYFIRAYHHARNPSAVMRLVAYYFPLAVQLDPSATPTLEARSPLLKGTPAYHSHCVGGSAGLALLYVSAGSLYLEGAAELLLSSTYSALSSIRSSTSTVQADGGIAGWRRDRDFARKYFERAKILDPDLEVPVVPPEIGEELGGGAELLMPSIEIKTTPGKSGAPESGSTTSKKRRRTGTVRGRGREVGESESLASSIVKESSTMSTGYEDVDSPWYLIIPGLVGAGTALLVVTAIGLSSWRRSQG
ncbi:hypothetical protein BJ322DRAFT_999930 [Thelephora terrestris]|uniref:CS domain-containing protein n=1 Tax=Thelephora terrestris TaxID=56493 RepID=A0A9P6LB64_9AGAM|nr:hypothetical protein BJ322DRAFT_999930 [Thelephora terrestris]